MKTLFALMAAAVVIAAAQTSFAGCAQSTKSPRNGLLEPHTTRTSVVKSVKTTR